jgi:hypothetical protein
MLSHENENSLHSNEGLIREGEKDGALCYNICAYTQNLCPFVGGRMRYGKKVSFKQLASWKRSSSSSESSCPYTCRPGWSWHLLQVRNVYAWVALTWFLMSHMESVHFLEASSTQAILWVSVHHCQWNQCLPTDKVPHCCTCLPVTQHSPFEELGSYNQLLFRAIKFMF